ncbi:MAG: SWIM zinc finger family protein [Anaeromyxobacteraceae bacterium]
MAFYGGFPPYVPVAERQRLARQELARLRKKGHAPEPVVIEGRHIATTFWGKAWCDHLEGHADLETRLPRGRRYARNGAVIDLKITRGAVEARVMGSELYSASVAIRPLAPARWRSVRERCSGSIGTVVELLSGKLSEAVMSVLCHREEGLFPDTEELTLDCSCPDGAWLCKHLAAVLYGVGARLDQQPELLFTLRGVDLSELVAQAGTAKKLARPARQKKPLDRAKLGAIFGIELEREEPAPRPRRPGRRATARARRT